MLLEKIAGQIYVNKLRAICLFEADFNYWNKLIFAKHMMKKAQKDGTIPDEIFSKKGSHCDDAVMVKRTFCDIARIMHHPAGISELDFGDCYDRMAHPPTSLALQSFGVPPKGSEGAAAGFVNHAILLENWVWGI